MAFFACKKDIELLHETVPEIVTEECTDITESSAVLTCKLTNQGSTSVEYGFYYSEAPNNTPTAKDKTIFRNNQSSKWFTYTLTGLKENTTYYVRAYARNRVGEAQGKIVQFTTLSKKLPTMGSTSVTNVTTNSATLSGNIASAGTGTVKERGFCLSTTKTPTIADSCIVVGSGIGSFNYTLTELEDGITFYVRAYATSEVGTAYGETMSFTTASEQLPIVVTKSVTEITPWYATLNGELESEGTSSVTEMGFCYSATTQTPTLLDEYVKVNGSSFASVITTLSEGTTYYVRAYATNSKGTAYGETVSFKTKTNSSNSVDIVEGAIQAAFSVSDTKKVYFSQGNLQYQPNTGTWRFAENQYDMIGDANSNISSTYSGWIDLFGYGTSGYNNKYPYLATENNNDYCNNSIAGTNYDWGIYNKISNGGNTTGLWRTLTKDEWYYILFLRTDATTKKGAASVNGVAGYLLLPDNCVLPDGISFIAGCEFEELFNKYSLNEWQRLKNAGAIFLPITYERIGTWLSSDDYGVYWTSSWDNLYNAPCDLFFWAEEEYRQNCIDIGSQGEKNSYGNAVRLVQDIK